MRGLATFVERYAGPGVLALLGAGLEVSGVQDFGLALLLFALAALWAIVVTVPPVRNRLFSGRDEQAGRETLAAHPALGDASSEPTAREVPVFWSRLPESPVPLELLSEADLDAEYEKYEKKEGLRREHVFPPAIMDIPREYREMPAREYCGERADLWQQGESLTRDLWKVSLNAGPADREAWRLKVKRWTDRCKAHHRKYWPSERYEVAIPKAPGSVPQWRADFQTEIRAHSDWLIAHGWGCRD